MEKLKTPIEFLKGVGPERAQLLKDELGVFTFGDLLHYYPFRYIDKSKFNEVGDILSTESYVQLKGKIYSFRMAGFGKKQRLVADFEDDTGSLELVWFKKIDWIKKSVKAGAEYIVYGKPNKFGRGYSIAHPELKPVTNQTEQANAPLEPVYNTSEKLKKKYLDTKGILKLQRQLFETISPADVVEFLPLDLLDKLKFQTRFLALRNIHFPPDGNQLKQAQTRIKFEELFLIQVRVIKMQSSRNIVYKGFVLTQPDNYLERFYKEFLPFNLTGAQIRVLKEIRQDMRLGKQMNRLLQGDVGSGKTVVSLMAMLMAVDNELQTALMAPTEILAQQHFAGLKELTEGLGVNIALLTGSTKQSERKQLLTALKEGALHILIGTHALIEDWVAFKNLGLVVIDEQHRFGVAQRAKLWKKTSVENTLPHVLVMTATPIPRTLAMTIYGDLEVSVIDELPPGRKPVQTLWRTEASRLKVFGSIAREIEKGRQVYVVYPLIDESETLDYANLMEGFDGITRQFPLPKYKVSMVHGQMKPADKDFEMQRFVKGETQIMVATTVIEVGVNVPNASVMIIESAERFGLSQLHQLRGRVGRGAEQSFCILMTGNKLSDTSRKRMQIMTETNDGFKISEEDLKLRGPGDIEGTQQSGLVDLKLANITKDQKILELARHSARLVIENDPYLDKHENSFLKQHLQDKFYNKIDWSRVS